MVLVSPNVTNLPVEGSPKQQSFSNLCDSMRSFYTSGGQFWYGTGNWQDIKRSAPAQSLHKSKSHCRQPTVNVPVTVSWQSSQMIQLSSIPGSNSCPDGHLIVLPRASTKWEKWDAPRGTNTANTSVKHGSVSSIGRVIWDQLSTVTTRERAHAA